MTNEASGGHAIVLADGAAPRRAALEAAWPGWDDRITLVVAADGGARHAAGLGLRIDRWVGDGDSIAPADLDALAAAGVEVDRVEREKDASDTELAMLAATAAGVEAITIVGGLGGGRVDHALTNVAMLAHPALAGRIARLYDEHAARISLLAATPADGHANADFVGHVDDVVTLVPLGGAAEGVTTLGLRYPLVDQTLEEGSSRGLSNVRTRPRASVTLRSGRLLVIETPANLRP